MASVTWPCGHKRTYKNTAPEGLADGVRCFECRRKNRQERILRTLARNDAIIEAHRAGEDATAIGARYGLKRRRVLAIVRDAGEVAPICRDPDYPARALRKAAELAGTTTTALRSRSRTRIISRARWAVWRGMAARGVSDSGIGRRFGMDHTSVGHALREVPYIAARDPAYAAFLDCVNSA